MIQSVEHHIAPIFAVSHKVIALIVKNHLIRADILMRSFVQLLICAVLIVIVMQLFSLFYGGVDELNVIKKRLIVGFAPIIDGIDMLDTGFEILV